VHEDAVDPLDGDQVQGSPDGIRPLGATGNHLERRGPDVRLEQFEDDILTARRYRDHKTGEVGGGRCPQSTNRVDQQRFATDLSKCLWCLTTQPYPETGRRDDRRSTHDAIMPDGFEGAVGCAPQ
jgi:hypothetical protein